MEKKANLFQKALSETRRLYNWVLSWADHKWAVPALCVTSFTEASFFLIPPDVLIIAMGASRPRKALYYAFLTSIFSLLGALFGYWIGMTLWNSVKDYFFTYIFTPEQFAIVETHFRDNTFLAVFVGAFTPIPFKAFTVIGGVLSAPLAPFVLGTVIGRSARYFILGGLFFFFGEQVKTYIDRHFEKATATIGALVVGAAVFLWWRKLG